MARITTTTHNLGPRGARLYRAVAPELGRNGADRITNPVAELLLIESCRAADRLEKLDQLLRGDASAWARVKVTDGGTVDVLVDDVLKEARLQAAALSSLLNKLEQYKNDGGNEAPSPERMKTIQDAVHRRRYGI